jgi:hypothetical protein
VFPILLVPLAFARVIHATVGIDAPGADRRPAEAPWAAIEFRDRQGATGGARYGSEFVM